MHILEREEIIKMLKDKNLSKVARGAEISTPTIYKFMDMSHPCTLDVQKKISDYLTKE